MSRVLHEVTEDNISNVITEQPHQVCHIPDRPPGDAQEMQVWYDRALNRTYLHAAGEFSNQDTFWCDGIVPIGDLVTEYVAEIAGDETVTRDQWGFIAE